MSVNSMGSLTSAASTGSQMGVTMLKKGMDQQASEMAQLLQGLPQAQALAPQPGHLGQNVDMKA